MPGPLVVPIALGLGQILGNLFGNLFGASKQSSAAEKAAKAQTDAQTRAAELEYKALTEALDYQKSIDARDYSDWLNREARDRTDWENQERRLAPRRALSDSAVRTLADYIRVPGMQPAQEIPVQQWRAPQMQQPMSPSGQPTSTTMPIGGGQTLYSLAQPQTTTQDPRLLTKYGSRTFRDFA